MKLEIETWVNEKIYESTNLEAIIEKLENFLFLMLESMAFITNTKNEIDS